MELFPLFSRRPIGVILRKNAEVNKKLICLKCKKQPPEVLAYGWTYCYECDKYLQLFYSAYDSSIFDVRAIYDKHKDHEPKPCCNSRKILKELGLID